MQIVGNDVFRVRVSNFSLSFRQIRPLEFVGTRKKATLRIKTYAWAPVLGVFNKLREVGVSPYLGFTLYLSVLQSFGWFEALNGRLIGFELEPRWKNVRDPCGQSVTIHGLI